MRLSWLLLLFLPATCLADGLMPSINDVPLFWGLTQNNPTYKTAAFKAQEAFFVQSGVTKQYGLITDFTSNVSHKVEGAVADTIDNHTPLSSKHVLFVVAVGYTALVKKEVTRSFKNPLFPIVTNTVSIGESHKSVGFSVPF